MPSCFERGCQRFDNVFTMSRLPVIENPHRKPYPSFFSDAEWLILKPLLPKPKGFGHPVEVDLREILNAIFYMQRTKY